MKAGNGIAAPKADKLVSESIVQSVAIAPPAVRMVVIIAYAWQEGGAPVECKADIIPVVAIRAGVRDNYARRVPHDSYPEAEQNHEEMIRQGWRFVDRETFEDLLIHSEEYGVCELDLAIGNNCVTRSAVCKWPASEDEERFDEAIKELKTEALAKRLRLSSAIKS